MTPYFAKRAIFFADKFRDHLLTVGAGDVLNRREELIDSLYCDSLSRLNKFISERNIGYFIIETDFYDPEFIDSLKGSPFQYKKQQYELIKNRRNSDNFILLQLAKARYEFKLEVDGKIIFVVNSKKLQEKNEESVNHRP